MASKTIILVGLGTVGAALAFTVYRQNQLKRQVDDVQASDTVATINDNFNFVGNIMDKVTTAVTGKTRGERNNNPLNIRESKGDTTHWQGERVTDDDKAFEEFTHVKFGFRAGARILKSYNRRGINTIHSIVHTFAPTNENDSDHYADMVSKWTGISKHLPINVNNNQTVTKVLQAMARMEVGKQYPFDAVRKGVELA
ncbi:virion protein [Photobacterium profundum]|uniref:virion protein n=1 Tax=Photobacterium profundum TaxID=74109 RepID=UPI003D0C7FA8